LITSQSLSHTKARHEANKNGARTASMPLVTEDMLMRTLAIDYIKVKEVCDKYAEILSKGSRVKITSPAGTDLSFSIENREGQSDGGIFHEKGIFGNLPAGEAFIAPVEGTAEGKLVIDGSMAAVGLVDEPIIINVKNGSAVEISGGESAEKLNKIMDKYGEKARNIAELGIGLNPAAELTGFILEDEKIAGSCHIALGDNSTFGGTVSVDSHLDGVILNPTLFVDGKEVEIVSST
jgi:leucyl aminopeptidase (aminopeptidase T)